MKNGSFAKIIAPTKESDRPIHVASLIGKIAIAAGAGYLLWRNREELQKLVDFRKISTKIKQSPLGETVRTEFNKLTESFQHRPKTDDDATSRSTTLGRPTLRSEIGSKADGKFANTY